MKGLKKVLLVAAIATPFAAQAELKSIDDATMSDVSGQSGLVIEAGFGTLNRTNIYNLDWSTAGIKIDAFKWEVDTQAWSATNNDITMTDAVVAGQKTLAGFIAKDIRIAGKVDVTIDAVADTATAANLAGAGAGAATLAAAGQLAGAGGIGITFGGSEINFRVGDMGVYLAGVGQTSSFGAIEIINMNVDGLELVVRGNGL